MLVIYELTINIKLTYCYKNETSCTYPWGEVMGRKNLAKDATIFSGNLIKAIHSFCLFTSLHH